MQSKLYTVLSLALFTAVSSLAASAQSIKTSINFPNATLGIATNPATNRVYVVEPSITGTTDSIGVIDGSQDVLLQSISVPFGAAFTTVNYLTNRVYVAGCDYSAFPSPCTVTVIDGSKNTVITTIPITSNPGLGLTGITVSPITGSVYVANGNDNVVNIINGKTNALAGSISLNGNSPSSIAINPICNTLYVPFGDNHTAIVNASTKKITSTITFGSSIVGAAANFATGNIFLSDSEPGPSKAGVFNSKGKQLASVTVSDSPLGVDVDPVTNLAFVASTGEDDVAVINGKTNTFQSFVNNVPASYLAVNFATQKVYVSGPLGVFVLTEK